MHPESMSPRERASEIATIIATAIARLHATQPKQREVSLGFSPRKSVNGNSSLPGLWQ